LVSLVVEAPAHLDGTVYLPQPLLTASNETVFVVDGNEQEGPFELKGGRVFVQQQLKRG
jgi:hypothetical protein